jgi:cyanophycin synthetase
MKKDILIRSVTPLRGPNMWTYHPVLEARVDIGALEDFPSNTIPGFYERLSAWLPSLADHRCSYGEPGGFLRRLREGTWPGHILEHVTLELQNLAGLPGGFGRARETSERGVYKVVVRAWNETVTGAALNFARDLVMSAIEDRAYDVGAAVLELKQLCDVHCLGPSTSSIVNAAELRRIPAIRLSEGNLVQLGHGAAQHRIWTAETDLTSAIAQGISQDKDLARGLMKSCGVPVPEGRLVKSAEDAWEAAEDVGLPVVVKPNSARLGRAVFTKLTTREEVEAAFVAAREETRNIIVEHFVSGQEHRLLVIGGRMVAAARGEPAMVTGDGVSTVAALVEKQINSDPRRGVMADAPLNPMKLDEVVRFELARQGATPESVPAPGAVLLVRRDGNLAEDVTDLVHPSIATAVTLAARVVGLDIAGIDFVAEDIAKPLALQEAAVVAVNSGPGLQLHLKPARGEPRPVGPAIVGHLFPHGETGRIPLVGITGSDGLGMVGRLVARLLQLTGKRVGLACRDGLFLDRRVIARGDHAHWRAAHRLLINRSVEAAVLENGARSLVAEGLAYDRCRVGVVMGLDERDTIEEFDIRNPDQMFNVLRTQVDVVLPEGAAVLNAEDPLVASMAKLCDGAVVFFSTVPEAPPLAAHRGAGGRAVFTRGGHLVLATGAQESVLTQLAAVPLGSAANGEPGVTQVLAAIATAWALDIPLEIIRAGIETFDPHDANFAIVGAR